MERAQRSLKVAYVTMALAVGVLVMKAINGSTNLEGYALYILVFAMAANAAREAKGTLSRPREALSA